MTDRRSLQSSAARDSRAFQFVPGHVGGRVASAQPVRRRRTIGASIARTVPDGSMQSLNISIGSVWGAGYLNADTVVALIATTGFTGVAVPSGWRELDRGTVVGGHFAVADGEWVLGAMDEVSSPGSTFAFTYTTRANSQLDRVELCVVRGYGVSAAGTWSHTISSEETYPATFADDVPPGSAVWAQIAYLRNTYSDYSGPVSIDDNDVITTACWPSDGTTQAAWWDSHTPAVGTATWGGTGSFGTKSATSMTVGWQ